MLFWVVRVVNRLTKAEAVNAPAPVPTKEEQLLTEIRDILKAR